MQEIKTNPTVRHTTPLQLLAAFAATVAVLFVLLLGACALPAQPVLEHVYDSAQTIQQEGLYPEYFGFKLFQMDNYTDTIMLFEAAAMGEQDPLTAMMTATAYNVDNFETMAGDLAVYCERTIPLATGAQKAVHLVPFSYARYWHGYLIWLRPLLCVMSITGVRVVQYLVLFALLAVILWQLLRQCAAGYGVVCRQPAGGYRVLGAASGAVFYHFLYCVCGLRVGAGQAAPRRAAEHCPGGAGYLYGVL